MSLTALRQDTVLFTHSLKSISMQVLPQQNSILSLLLSGTDLISQALTFSPLPDIPTALFQFPAERLQQLSTASAFIPLYSTVRMLIMFTLFFGRKVAFVVPVFILIEGCIYGFGSWWIMYLYTWPLLTLIAWIFRKQESVWFWSTLSAVFGLLFGLFCSLPYVVMGAWDGGIKAGLYAGFTWWVAGIPWDLVHGISNFVLMLVLYYPIRNIMLKTNLNLHHPRTETGKK